MERQLGEARTLFSVCIPAYNRSHHLNALLDSVLSQDFRDFEIVICEDKSREREEIARIVREYQSRYSGIIRYFENEANLGFDGNIRNLTEKSSGQFCFFMGNDDIMCEHALATAASLIRRYPAAGLIMRAYGLFDKTADKVTQVIRYLSEEREISPSPLAIKFAFRRSGVISGYIVDRDIAKEAATNKFDGTLYYQMHLTVSVLTRKSLVFTPEVLVLCRGSEPPEFGSSTSERGKFVPGRYTPQARLNMVAGALSIIRDLKETKGIDVMEEVIHDYSNYFYPYIKDQLNLPFADYYKLYRDYGRMGFRRYPMFHLYFVLCYLLGEKRFDILTAAMRKRMGRSPRFGKLP